jgi:hypothetical protein
LNSVRQLRNWCIDLIVVFATGKCDVFAGNPGSNVRLGHLSRYFPGACVYNRVLSGIGVLFYVDLPHFVSPCAGELHGSQIGKDLMELRDTTMRDFFASWM